MSSQDRIVITGLGMVTPLGLDTKSTWDNLVKGESGISELPSSYDRSEIKTYVVGEIKGYDPNDSMDIRESRHLDRFSQIMVTATLEAVKHSALDLQKIDPFRVGLSMGSGIGGGNTFRVSVTTNYKRLSPFTIPKISADQGAAAVSRIIGAQGPSYAVVSACATGGDAIFNAANMLKLGQADVVIAGGSDASISEFTIGAFNACKALATKYNDNPKEASRPFDAKRDGFVMGEAASAMVLETEEHAKKRGAHIVAELAGSSSTTDAYHVTRPHPEGLGAIKAVKLALEDAKLRPDEVHYINAHGTSTYWNDLIETKVFKNVFGEHAYKVKISSTKSMTGHLLGATGVAEACFAALSIKNSVIPPTINLVNPDPECDLDYTPSIAHRGNVDVAISTSFGFGGHNSCVAVRRFAG